MTDALRNFCRAYTVASPLPQQFNDECRHRTIPVASNFTTLHAKCDAFLGFVEDLFCPLDPCVQVTQSALKAPEALCDLMQCTHTKAEIGYVHRRIVVPLTCPDYLATIVRFCQTKQNNEPLSAAACHPYPTRFAEEGCEMVLGRVFNVSLPLDFCRASFCESIAPTDYPTYCREVLRIDPEVPVAVPGYIAWLNGSVSTTDECSAPAGTGIKVLTATFGIGSENCSVLHDNLLAGLQQRCNGKLSCTYGNADMLDASSKWDPALDANVIGGCDRKFHIEYSCVNAGRVYVINAGIEAAFQAVPFNCDEDLKFKTFRQQPDETIVDHVVAYPKPTL